MGVNEQKRVLFLGLTTFSRTGGVEKFNKCFLKALSGFEQEYNIASYTISLHDTIADEKYFPAKNFKGFSSNRLLFIMNSIQKAKDFDYIFIGHINMAIVGYFIKLFFPKKKVMLVAHGYEVWYPLKGFKKRLVKKADQILAVSNFTKSKLVAVQQIDEKKVSIFYNTIDPYFHIPPAFKSNKELRNRYHILPGDFVLFTLARLSFTEGYKGYDMVIKCLPELIRQIPHLKYVIAGKYDKEEKDRLDHLIQELGIEKAVVFTGFLQEAEVKDHYQMADLFIMPSQGEGFGIVFIEAMACGLPVIAGNLDGSVDALKGGELGVLVNPHNKEEITRQIIAQYQNCKQWTDEDKHQLQQKTLNYFGFEQYKKRLEKILLEKKQIRSTYELDDCSVMQT